MNLLARDRIFRDYTSDNSDASTALAGIPPTRNRATHTGIQPGALNEVWIKHDDGDAVVVMSNTMDLDISIITQLRNDLINLFNLD